jgi:hypothetical protein
MDDAAFDIAFRAAGSDPANIQYWNKVTGRWQA